MSHAANAGAEKIFQTGIPVSASVMVPCPWFQEAVNILKQYPNVAVGVHLTLNAEWDNYKWGPVLGKEAVSSLVVDSTGYFTAQSTWHWRNKFKLDEMERELRDQIEGALAAGLDIDYLDNHMGAAMMTKEQRSIVEKLAKEYNLGISGYFGEAKTGGVEGYYRKDNMKDFFNSLDTLQRGQTTLMVNHPGSDTPEMRSLKLSSSGKSLAKQRARVTRILSSKKFRNKVKQEDIVLINYEQLIKTRGLENMQPQ